MAGEGKQFSSEYQPGNNRVGGRTAKKDLYAGQIREFEDLIAEDLPRFYEKLRELAMGEATEQVVNVKTGALVERRLPPNEKVLQYLVNRLAGKPVSVKELHLEGQIEHRSLTILVGPAADEHQQQRERGQLAMPATATPVPALPPGHLGPDLPGQATGAGDKVIDLAVRRKAA